MSEASDLQKIFHEPIYKAEHFAKSTWVSLYDQNSSNTFLQYNLETYKNAKLLLNDSYMVLSLRLSPAIVGQNLTANDKICFKNGTQSLFQNITVKSPSGITLVAETDSSVILRDIHEILEKSIDNEIFQNDLTNGPYLCGLNGTTGLNPGNGYLQYGTTVFPNLTAGGVTLVGNALQGTAAAGGGNTVIQNAFLNTTYNRSYQMKCDSFSNIAVWNAGLNTWDVDVVVKLNQLSAFFSSIPLCFNNPLIFQFSWAKDCGNQSAMFNCFQTNGNPISCALRNGNGSARLMMRSVEFLPNHLAEFNSLITKGYSYSFKYLSASGIVFYQNNNQTNYSKPISASDRNIKRIHYFGTSVNALTAPNTVDNSGQIYGINPIMPITQLQLLINGQQFYDNPPGDQISHYMNVLKETPNSGESNQKSTALSYSVWSKLKRYHIINLEKMDPIIGSSNANYQINIIRNAGAFDEFCIFEKSIDIRLDMSVSGVRITTNM